MHHPTDPVDWKEIAASYDPRGLPFLRYYVEAGLVGDRSSLPPRVWVRGEEGAR